MPHDNPSRESPLFSLGNQTLISVPMSALRAHWHSVRHRDRRAASATVCERGALQTGMVPSSARADTSGKQRPKQPLAQTSASARPGHTGRERLPAFAALNGMPVLFASSTGCRRDRRNAFCRNHAIDPHRPACAGRFACWHTRRLAAMRLGALLVAGCVSATPAAQCRSSGLGGRSPAFVPQARPLTDPSCSTFDVRRHFRQLTR